MNWILDKEITAKREFRRERTPVLAMTQNCGENLNDRETQLSVFYVVAQVNEQLLTNHKNWTVFSNTKMHAVYFANLALLCYAGLNNVYAD